jgi:acyl carrier protein
MSQEEILARLGAIVQEATGIPADRVQPDKSFADDLDVDSLSMVEIATMAEDAFGVPVPDDELSKLRTVGDVVGFLSKAGVAA